MYCLPIKNVTLKAAKKFMVSRSSGKSNNNNNNNIKTVGEKSERCGE